VAREERDEIEAEGNGHSTGESRGSGSDYQKVSSRSLGDDEDLDKTPEVDLTK